MNMTGWIFLFVCFFFFMAIELAGIFVLFIADSLIVIMLGAFGMFGTLIAILVCFIMDVIFCG